MKYKFIFPVVLLFVAVNLSAQKIGIQAGYVNVSEQTNGSSLVFPELVSGFQVGPVSETELFNNIDIRYGVLYTYLMSTFDGVTGTNNYNGHLVDVPVRVQFAFPIDNVLKLFAFAGPNFNFGLAQKTINKTTVFGSEINTTYDRYKADADNDDVYDVNRFDVRLGLGAGAQYRNVQLRVGYDWGMLDLNNTDDISLKRNQLTASLVYQF
ncbi:MAG: outer membrane beta-barrel protein [Paludibacter sp.]|nr:outer membrane beta-barrel protein [Paludibacter sp.]